MACVPGLGVGVPHFAPTCRFSKAGSEGDALEDETRWRKWVDERLVKVVTANIYRSWE